jgi:anti-anti-sigma regulatory factor/anti-sigma regulatory factor (Ser/Thr protein kinase)
LNSLIIPDCLNDVYAFERLLALEDDLYARMERCVLDLRQVSFINPFGAVNLLLLGRNFIRKTGSRIILRGLRPDIHAYLERMDFLKAGIFVLEDAEAPKLSRSRASTSLIEIIEIPAKEGASVRAIAGVVSLFRKRAPQIFKSAMSEERVDSFVTVISEICQNVFEHSMDSGFVAVQTYRTAKGPVVHLVVADSGIGIEGSFARSGKDYGTGSDLLLKAVTSPISSKRPFGYGLCRVSSIVDQMNGNLYLRSNAASIAVMNTPGKGRVSFARREIPFFQGTQISFFVSGGK